MVWWQVCVMSSWVLRLLHSDTRDVLCTFYAFKCLFLAAACPSTWETRCLMFTKLLCRETTTTCSSDRALDCRDRLYSKPNSHSGNTITCHCCVVDGLLLRPESHTDLKQKLWVARDTPPFSDSRRLNKPQAASNFKQRQWQPWFKLHSEMHSLL